MGRSLENLGLAPNLLRLPGEVRDLIHYGNRNGHLDGSDAAVVVCVEMFRASHGVDEIWMIMTDPNNAISEAFFEEDGEQAEAYLDRIVSEVCEAANRSEYGDE